MDYAIETISLTKTFGDWWGRAKVYAVDDLNLKIRTNEVFGLLGPNGSGKTTTIKMLLGLLYPDAGQGPGPRRRRGPRRSTSGSASCRRSRISTDS